MTAVRSLLRGIAMVVVAGLAQLAVAQTRQLEGTLTTREEALQWVKEEFPPGSNFSIEKQNITSENP